MNPIEEEILVFLSEVYNERELPYATQTEIWQRLFQCGVLIVDDKDARIDFAGAMRYLIGEKYIHQDFMHFSITSSGINQAENIKYPPIDYTSIALDESRRSNRIAQVNTVIAVVSLLLAVLGTLGGVFIARERGVARPFSGKAEIQISSGIDINQKPVVTTALSNWFQIPPQFHEFNGIPYDLSVNNLLAETESETSPNSNTIIFPVNIPKPIKIHVLINMSYGHPRFTGGKEIQGVQVCNITLFTDKNQQTIPLVAGTDIREWVIGSSGVVSTVGNHVQTVFSGYHSASGEEAVIDHLEIILPDDWQEETLRYIEFVDRSQEFFQSKDPGIVIFGLTVEYQK